MATHTQESLLRDYTPKEPIKRIFSDKDIEPFTKSEAFARIVDFVKLLNTSVSNKKISDPCHESEVKFLSFVRITVGLFLTQSFFRAQGNCYDCSIAFPAG